MKKDWSHLDKWRKSWRGAVSENGVTYGDFIIPSPATPRHCFFVVACDAEHPDSEGWEHVSIHKNIRVGKAGLQQGTPSWDEMCFIKSLFWDDSETVIQFHPEGKSYINIHGFTLHLWMHVDGHKLPPSILV